MARRATLSALVLAVLAALALPATASATIRIAVADNGPGAGKQLLVSGTIGDDRGIVLTQENEGATPNIAITSAAGQNEGFILGAGCRVLGGPPRGRCATSGITSIAVNLSDLSLSNLTTRPTGVPPDVNDIDFTAVSQFTPDGSAPVPVSVIGGPGADTIVGGSGRLTVAADAGNDVINGGPADDDVDEGPGNDIVLAGAGNDRFGDFHTPGSDILSGGPGRDQVIARGTVTLNDLLCNDGANADAPGQFPAARSVSAPEGTLECPGTGAARDLIVGIESVAQVFDDSAVDFTGSSADELLQGNANLDRLEGGGGRDSLFGLEGSDLLLARDEGEDARIDCGEGRADEDRAVVDAVDPVEPNCETIERGRAGLPGPVGGGAPAPVLPGFPPTPPPSPPQGNQPSSGNEGNGAGGGDNGRTPPEVEIPTRTAFVRRGRIQIRVRCVYRAKNCVGKLTLTAAQNKRVGKRRVRKGQRLASGNVNVPWGTSKTTTLRAPGSLTSLLRALKGKALKVRAQVQVRDGAAPRTAKTSRAARVVTLGLQR